jgi:hypothetical protein
MDQDEVMAVNFVQRWSAMAAGQRGARGVLAATRGKRRRFLLFLGHEAVSACWAGPLGRLGGLRSGKLFPFFCLILFPFILVYVLNFNSDIKSVFAGFNFRGLLIKYY